VHAEDFLIDKSSYWQTVKTVSEDFPKFYSVPPLALIVEAVNTVDGCAFMVTAK